MQHMCNSILKPPECVPILQKNVGFLSIPTPYAVSPGMLGKFLGMFPHPRFASY